MTIKDSQNANLSRILTAINHLAEQDEHAQTFLEGMLKGLEIADELYGANRNRASVNLSETRDC